MRRWLNNIFSTRRSRSFLVWLTNLSLLIGISAVKANTFIEFLTWLGGSVLFVFAWTLSLCVLYVMGTEVYRWIKRGV
jgi:hypothetical protein